MSIYDKVIKLHETLCGKGRVVLYKKNHDYAGEGADFFQNFRHHGSFGIIVRLHDKLARLENFEKAGKLKVYDETIDDTVIDTINYLVLWLAYRRYGGQLQDEVTVSLVSKTKGKHE